MSVSRVEELRENALSKTIGKKRLKTNRKERKLVEKKDHGKEQGNVAVAAAIRG